MSFLETTTCSQALWPDASVDLKLFESFSSKERQVTVQYATPLFILQIVTKSLPVLLCSSLGGLIYCDQFPLIEHCDVITRDDHDAPLVT